MPTPTTTRETLARLRDAHIASEIADIIDGAVIAALSRALDIDESEVLLGYVEDVREVTMRALALAAQAHVLALAEDARE